MYKKKNSTGEKMALYWYNIKKTEKHWFRPRKLLIAS
jgi:hypothetical protein